MDSRDRRGPVVVSEEFTHVHVTEHDSILYKRKGLLLPSRGAEEGLARSSVLAWEIFILLRWGSQIIMVIIDES